MMTFMQLFCFHIGCQNHTQNLVYFVQLAGDNVGKFYPNNNSMNQFDWWYEMQLGSIVQGSGIWTEEMWPTETETYLL